MGVDEYDQRTAANMEVALERECALMQNSDSHVVQSQIAEAILKDVREGKRSLGQMTNIALATARAIKDRDGERPV